MSKPCFGRMSRRSACRRLMGMAGAPLALSWLTGVKPAFATSSDVMRVEEDWYLKIGTPNPDDDSPQISTVISPSGSVNGYYSVFALNCATQPNFASGGVQLQLWYKNSLSQSKSNTDWDSLQYTGEEVRYTSVLAIEGSNLVFDVINGTSQSWGTFGTGELKMSVPTWRSNLGNYDPQFSVQTSRIGYASHRVRQFVLERVRYYSATGDLLSEDDTAQVVFSYDAA